MTFRVTNTGRILALVPNPVTVAVACVMCGGPGSFTQLGLCSPVCHSNYESIFGPVPKEPTDENK